MRDDLFEDLLEPFFTGVTEGLLEVFAGVLLLDAELEWGLFAVGELPTGFFAAVVLLAVLLPDALLCDALGVLGFLEAALV